MAKARTGNAFARILISLIGAALIFWGVATAALGFIGERETAIITDIRREGGARKDAKPGRYTYNIGYTFQLDDGKNINGVTKRIGDSIYLKADGKSTASVRYLSFFPYINALEQDTGLGFGQLIYIAAGGFLIVVMNRR